MFLYERSPMAGGQMRSPWAIKKANRCGRVAEKEEDVVAKRMEKEAGILRGLRHPNVIGFRGYKRNADGTRWGRTRGYS